MTMWGMIGSTFGALLDGFLAWHGGFLEEVGGMHLTELLKGVFFALALTIVLAIFMVGLLFLFIKVALAMLMRIALLAVLIAVSPLAFAFYASDATSHWTKKWGIDVPGIDVPAGVRPGGGLHRGPPGGALHVGGAGYGDGGDGPSGCSWRF